jgi:hypothetical protein
LNQGDVFTEISPERGHSLSRAIAAARAHRLIETAPITLIERGPDAVGRLTIEGCSNSRAHLGRSVVGSINVRLSYSDIFVPREFD